MYTNHVSHPRRADICSCDLAYAHLVRGMHTRAGHLGLRTVEAILPGQIILEAQHPVQISPTRTSIQVAHDAHMDSYIIGWVNHSCAPNTSVEIASRGGLYRVRLRALQPLCPGDEITFNYLTTEYDLHEPFVCQCQDVGCYGAIRGFRYLPRAQQIVLRPHLAPYLRQLVDQGCSHA